MKRFAACLMAIAAAGTVTDAFVVAGPTAAAQDKPAPKKPDEKTPPPKDEKKAVEEVWGTDYEKALATAKKEKKIVLADFTGSDW
jgi:hypothetical protein